VSGFHEESRWEPYDESGVSSRSFRAERPRASIDGARADSLSKSALLRGQKSALFCAVFEYGVLPPAHHNTELSISLNSNSLALTFKWGLDGSV
jgi:hypothetical protein